MEIERTIRGRRSSGSVALPLERGARRRIVTRSRAMGAPSGSLGRWPPFARDQGAPEPLAIPLRKEDELVHLVPGQEEGDTVALVEPHAVERGRRGPDPPLVEHHLRPRRFALHHERTE